MQTHPALSLSLSLISTQRALNCVCTLNAPAPANCLLSGLLLQIHLQKNTENCNCKFFPAETCFCPCSPLKVSARAQHSTRGDLILITLAFSQSVLLFAFSCSLAPADTKAHTHTHKDTGQPRANLSPFFCFFSADHCCPHCCIPFLSPSLSIAPLQ